MGNGPQLTAVHILLTYTCTSECDHCFVWGSPRQQGTLTLDQIEVILEQAHDVGTVDWIYFEGGEPFLFHPILTRSVDRAAAAGFQVGVVSNAYWATAVADALEWLRPLQGKVADLSISSDLYHSDEQFSRHASVASEAASRLDLPVDTITIAAADEGGADPSTGQLPHGASQVMYRGRAAELLAGSVLGRQWQELTECCGEDLRDPGRVHIDPLGMVHICQGITLGNVFTTPLADVWSGYIPDRHPIVGPLLAGGPAELVRRYDLKTNSRYADACHLCYEARRMLRDTFPEILGPDQIYGVLEET